MKYSAPCSLEVIQLVYLPSYQALRTYSYCALYLHTDCGAHTASYLITFLRKKQGRAERWWPSSSLRCENILTHYACSYELHSLPTAFV